MTLQVDRGTDDTVAFAEWAMGGGSKGSPAETPAAGTERLTSGGDGASRRRSVSRLRVSSASLHTIAEGFAQHPAIQQDSVPRGPNAQRINKCLHVAHI